MPLRDDDGPLEDAWTRIDAGGPLAGRTILSFADAAAREGELAGIPAASLGLHIPNDAEGRDVARWFGKVSLIAVDFPSFADGRGFSLGRRLRALGYDGRLRASGPVIADQYAYLRACGFDEVETPVGVSNRQPEAHWKAAADAITAGYQRGYPGPRNILEARRAAGSR